MGSHSCPLSGFCVFICKGLATVKFQLSLPYFSCTSIINLFTLPIINLPMFASQCQQMIEFTFCILLSSESKFRCVEPKSIVRLSIQTKKKKYEKENRKRFDEVFHSRNLFYIFVFANSLTYFYGFWSISLIRVQYLDRKNHGLKQKNFEDNILIIHFK